MADWYGPYAPEDVTDPTGPASGSYRVLRGGSFNYNARYMRAACRLLLRPELELDLIGFRVVWSSAGGQK